MALPDIKDAGILAGFTRWGWPWHGLCEGGVIGSSGKTITQPNGGDAWLIDKGLPALDIAPGVVASELSEGREWRNYGMISGGMVYGVEIPKQNAGGLGYRNVSYIHVDADGINWLVSIVGTFPSTNTVRLTLSIVRFGHFEQGVGAQTPITKVVDVSCEDVETSRSWDGGATVWNRYGRWVDLQDVWTNGSKALVCVFMGVSAVVDTAAVFSAIEITLTGSGGEDGSGLSLSATEVMGQSDLTTDGIYDGTNSGGTTGSLYTGIIGAPNSLSYEYNTCDGGSPPDCWTVRVSRLADGEFTWTGGTNTTEGNSTAVTQGYIFTYTRCRMCRYDSSGNVLAFRLKLEKIIDHWASNTPSVSGSLGPNTNYYFTGWACGYNAQWTVEIEGVSSLGWYLMQNDTVIDECVHKEHFTGSQQWTYNAGETPCPISPIVVPYTTVYNSTVEWTGSLSIPTSLDWKYTAGYPDLSLVDGWVIDTDTGNKSVLLSDDTTKVGIWRTDNIGAFYLLDPDRTYGTIATALGNKTTSETGTVYFAWQRKTGDFAFSANPICYV